MDTSEIYIKQCEKAVEIQDSHEPRAGDYYRSGNGNLVILPMKEHIKDFCTYECLYLVGPEDYWWLPTQDDLQKMIDEDAITQHQRMTEFILCCAYAPLGTPQPSHEQLWLAAIMDWKFNKRWDGSEWVTKASH